MQNWIQQTAASLAILAALALSLTSAHAQENKAGEGEGAQDTTAVAPMRIANGTRFGRWTVNCEAIAVNETACVLSQRLVRTSDNAFLTELLAFWSGDTKRSYIAARVPNGVYFPAGFSMKPADSEDRINFVWQSCGRDICEALLELPLDRIKKLEESSEIVAGYRPNLVSKPVVFRFSVAGAAEGLAALKASLAGQAEKKAN